MIDEVAHRVALASGSAGTVTGVLAYQELVPMIVAVGSLAIALASLVINVYFKKIKDDREAILFKVELKRITKNDE